MRSERPEVGVGQGSGAHAAGTLAGNENSAWPSDRARIGRSRREVAPAILQARRGQRRLPADTDVEHQLLVHAPVVLHEAGEVRELLADKPDRIDLAVIRITQQE